MIGAIVEFADLQLLCRKGDALPARTTVMRWLGRQGIAYRLDLRQRPFTTVDAINAAMGIGVQFEDKTPQLMDLI